MELEQTSIPQGATELGLEGLLPPDPLLPYVEILGGFAAGFQIIAVVSFLAFVLLMAIRTRLPGRILLLSGTLLSAAAAMWPWLTRSAYSVPLLGEQLLVACAVSFGMALAAVGAVRIAVAVVRERPLPDSPP